MVKTILIDDEPHSIQTLELIINEYCPALEITGTCTSFQAALKMLSASEPDLVFLDIEMPFVNGFELLELFGKINFGIIFVTAYNQYAIKAFKYSATDYLLKPVNIKELCRAVDRFCNNYPKPDYKILLENLREPCSKIAVPLSDGYEYLNIAEIIRISAEGRYSRIFTINNRSLLVTKNIGELAELLTGRNFCRIHNSYLVNLLFVKRYSRYDGGIVEMTDMTKLPVARQRKNCFIEMMKLVSR